VACEDELALPPGHTRIWPGRRTALIQQLILPTTGDREVHGNACLHPRYFQRAVGAALAARAGLALLHSHRGCPGTRQKNR
jgi:hypothetical protein